jgi:Ca2+-binding EF-hand superfamily protein
VREVLRELDSNKDGRISVDEFKVLIRQVLELMKEGS